MQEKTDCPVCGTEILARVGTNCPNCNHTISFYEGSAKKKEFSKYFAMSIILPFLSFVLIIMTSESLIPSLIASFIALYFIYVVCPLRKKELFSTRYEKIFFWGIWGMFTSLLLTLEFNIYTKILEQ